MRRPLREARDCNANPQEGLLNIHRALVEAMEGYYREQNGVTVLIEDTVTAGKKDFSLQQLSHDASH